jgi:hypothetical protein
MEWCDVGVRERFGGSAEPQNALKLNCCSCGRVAQLGEHLLCKQGVAGSNPVTSTKPILFHRSVKFPCNFACALLTASTRFENAPIQGCSEATYAMRSTIS